MVGDPNAWFAEIFATRARNAATVHAVSVYRRAESILDARASRHSIFFPRSCDVFSEMDASIRERCRDYPRVNRADLIDPQFCGPAGSTAKLR